MIVPGDNTDEHTIFTIRRTVPPFAVFPRERPEDVPQNPCDRSATEQLKLLESGESTAAGLIGVCLGRVGPAHATSAGALLEAARHADRRRAAGEAVPLGGLPVAFAADLPGRAGLVAVAEAAGVVVVDAAAEDGLRLLVAGAVSAAFVRDTSRADGVVPTLRPAYGPGLLTRAVVDLALFLPIIEREGPRSRVGSLDIGAHSDSLADREFRDAVADVAALLSLHGHLVRDLDAGRSRQPAPDVLVSVPEGSPQWTESALVVPVGTTVDGHALAVRFTAGPGLDRDLVGLARLVDADLVGPSLSSGRAPLRAAPIPARRRARRYRPDRSGRAW
jgi:hypothetical protein